MVFIVKVVVCIGIEIFWLIIIFKLIVGNVKFIVICYFLFFIYNEYFIDWNSVVIIVVGCFNVVGFFIWL